MNYRRVPRDPIMTDEELDDLWEQATQFDNQPETTLTPLNPTRWFWAKLTTGILIACAAYGVAGYGLWLMIARWLAR